MAIATAPAFAVCLAAALQPATQQTDPRSPPAVSLERVREGLERPHTLILPNPDEMAYFRAAVEEALVIESVLSAMRRDLAARPGRPILPPAAYPRPLPLSAGVDILALARQFRQWRHERAEMNARQTVQGALDEFCAVHDCSTVEPGSPPTEGFIGPGRAKPALVPGIAR